MIINWSKKRVEALPPEKIEIISGSRIDDKNIYYIVDDDGDGVIEIKPIYGKQIRIDFNNKTVTFVEEASTT